MPSHRQLLDTLSALTNDPEWVDHFFGRPLGNRAMVFAWAADDPLRPRRRLSKHLWSFKYRYSAIEEPARSDVNIQCPEGLALKKVAGPDADQQPRASLTVYLTVFPGQSFSEQICCEVSDEASHRKGTIRIVVDVLARFGSATFSERRSIDLEP